ncbi:UTP--glucose-1-phosphate uridylyltransferase [Corallococcus sp. AB004]|uniref:UTP--glucose-1-phosphate uridylyltransferase GalU n=1 Tax=Corallococcus TaxID=83461 RepID=UPI000EA3CC27|nr:MULTISPECIES: UTP--glucose-1-phosphate uridylyltransferase GalU [Corallococcus]NPC73290.1 UTP--glucose-1-phosphate uridylyltransferase GalU [Corallococcus exiguus]RKI04541.1 UTP--glucose-1-phosphate uridylyltransferase [Corallococcus sp. AB038B]RKI37647.1 UTP--glucose-1-phosphate uridylyltransferase [Corallococcus sp. AB004]
MSSPDTKAAKLIRKCVIPAAGLGTRFLPATKAVPKEMLPIVDTPTLQYIVEEAVKAGMEDVVVINGRGKGSIEDHFDIAFELETTMRARGKTADADRMRAIANLVRIISVRQKEPLGLGHAVLCAKSVIGDEPFGVLLGDDMIDSEDPGIGQLARIYQQHQKAVIALMEVPESETHMYGIAAGKDLGNGVIQIDHVVEKPKKGTAPSNLAVIGRYVLPPSIFPILETQTTGVGGEIQLTDGLATLQKTEGLLGYKFQGQRYDAGDKVGYLKANIAYALKRPDLRGGLLEYLREVVKTEKP